MPSSGYNVSLDGNTIGSASITYGFGRDRCLASILAALSKPQWVIQPHCDPIFLSPNSGRTISDTVKMISVCGPVRAYAAVQPFMKPAGPSRM